MDLQIQRKRIPYFAKFAKIKKPFTDEKHTLENGKIIYYIKDGEKYANHIETAGFYASSIISYGADESGFLQIMRHGIYPTLRLYPNLTGSHLDYNFKGISFNIDGKPVKEKAVKFEFDGMLHIYTQANEIKIKHTIFSARESKAFIELTELTNTTNRAVDITVVSNDKHIFTKPCFGVDRKSYSIYMQNDENMSVLLNPFEIRHINVAYCASVKGEEFTVDINEEYEKRKQFLENTKDFFVVETPDYKLNAMARYAKIRACESIFNTKSGLMHSPGGGYYYSAIWTNDQCEYLNPLFAYLGYDIGFKQAKNTYEMYRKYISSDKTLITSIIAEGDGIWHGANDRGDCAMYAYGCSRFLLSSGNKELALKYIDLIRDCIAYTKSQTSESGVIRSDSDELENRFESGSYNLCTSSIAYDAYISCAYLERELGNEDKYNELMADASALKSSIEKYFGRNVEGFDTYRYCEEETNLRSWISAPLTVGIEDRVDETVRALMSNKLLNNEGLVTRSGEKTFWDRSSLYALRGMFLCGKAEDAYALLTRYSSARLLGEHIPYCVEAFPEGNQAQLSAESGLYLRIYSEGILGYRPTGFNSFEIKPDLPEGWNEFAIRNMKLCGKNTDIYINRNRDSFDIKVICDGNEKIITSNKAVFTI